MSSIYDPNNFKLINFLSEQPLISGWFIKFVTVIKIRKGANVPFFFDVYIFNRSEKNCYSEIFRLSAANLPLFSATSKDTFCPSERFLIPAFSSAV